MPHAHLSAGLVCVCRHTPSHTVTNIQFLLPNKHSPTQRVIDTLHAASHSLTHSTFNLLPSCHGDWTWTWKQQSQSPVLYHNIQRNQLPYSSTHMPLHILVITLLMKPALCLCPLSLSSHHFCCTLLSR